MRERQYNEQICVGNGRSVDREPGLVCCCVGGDRLGHSEVCAMSKQDDSIVETGYWCHYEGTYFSDVHEILEGHYGYPCGDWDAKGKWQGHVVEAVAVVKLGQGD